MRARIVRDFDRLAANGIFIVNLSPGRGEPKYLSPEHMDQVKFTVQQASKRGMRLWIQDESDYPSGFAGGNISRQYPQLGMQGIVADIRVHVAPGQTLTMPAPSDTLAIFATKTNQQQEIEGVIPIPVYTHKSWQDAEMYFFFNESNKVESRMATVTGHGQAQAWDLATGEIHPISTATAEGQAVRLPLLLGPYETKVVVVGPLPSGAAAAEPSFASGNTLADLYGDWTLDLNGKTVTGPLKSWEELGTPSFAGPATYRKQFSAGAAPAGKRVFLEIADVHDYAKVKLNGKDLEAHAWQPYRWEITNAVKAGTNELEVEVRSTLPSRGPGAPPPASAAPSAAGGRGVRAARAGAAPPQSAPPAGRGRGDAPPSTSGLLGPVRLVAY